MKTLKEYLNESDRFAKTCGMRLTVVQKGYAKAEMVVEERHLNGANVCQGGVYFTLADLAFAAVTNSCGTVSLGIQNSISFLQPAYLGDTLIAEATEVYNHHRLPFCEMRVTNSQGDLLCVITGTAYRKKEHLSYEGLE